MVAYGIRISRWPAFRWLVRGDGRVSGDIGGVLVFRWHGWDGWVGRLRSSGSGLEQAPSAVPTAVGRCAGTAAAGGRIVIQRAGGVVLLFVVDRVGAGGLALAAQVIAVPGDGGGLAAG